MDQKLDNQTYQSIIDETKLELQKACKTDINEISKILSLCVSKISAIGIMNIMRNPKTGAPPELNVKISFEEDEPGILHWLITYSVPYKHKGSSSNELNVYK